ncbi:MAG: PDZ domain-containing protein [Myxococcota bacterium]|jgi:membrane-associated protease RseP (regulator of RpoE activity)|nr:PDZ domain-containing protein [Myxococcota bacterium]
MNARHSLSVFLILAIAALPSLAQAGDPIAYLGVQAQDVPAPLAAHLGLQEGDGVFVVGVQEGSPAQAAGIMVNDIILAIDGEAIRGARDFQDDVRSLSPGSQVRIALLHEGAPAQREATLQTLESGEQKLPGALQPFPHQAQRSQRYHSFKLINGESVEVSIDGAADDPSSQLTVTNKDGSFTVTIADLDSLPEPAREQARSAIEQANASPGSLFGPSPFELAPFDPAGLFREMQRLQDEQRRRIEDWMRRIPEPTPKVWPGAIKS